jgi:transposase
MRISCVVPKTITRMLHESHYGTCIALSAGNGKLSISETGEAQKRKKRFGKNILFSANPHDDPGWVITQYQRKDPIEDSFKLLKDPGLIRWRPCRHWTDTTIVC